MGSVNCTKWDNEENKTVITSTNNSNSNDKISNKSIKNNNKNIGKEELKLINNDSILNKIESKYNSKEAKGISYENKKVGETIVKIEISESEENKNIGEFIIIMDISESMGDYVPQIINNVIPDVLDKLHYDDTKNCHPVQLLFSPVNILHTKRGVRLRTPPDHHYQASLFFFATSATAAREAAPPRP